MSLLSWKKGSLHPEIKTTHPQPKIVSSFNLDLNYFPFFSALSPLSHVLRPPFGCSPPVALTERKSGIFKTYHNLPSEIFIFFKTRGEGGTEIRGEDGPCSEGQESMQQLSSLSLLPTLFACLGSERVIFLVAEPIRIGLVTKYWSQLMTWLQGDPSSFYELCLASSLHIVCSCFSSFLGILSSRLRASCTGSSSLSLPFASYCSRRRKEMAGRDFSKRKGIWMNCEEYNWNAKKLEKNHKVCGNFECVSGGIFLKRHRSFCSTCPFCRGRKGKEAAAIHSQIF